MRALPRVLALRDLVVVAAASMGPAFSLATTMAGMIAAAGRWTLLALGLITTIMVMIASGYLRLGERLRDAGSSYAWIRTAFGGVAGAYGAWTLLVANVFAVLATALPAGTYTLDLLAPALAGSPLAVALTGALWTAACALLLWYGLRPTALFAAALLLAELLVLGGAALLAALHPRPDAVALAAPAPFSASGLIAAIVIGIWMIDGWEVSASTAEEAEGDARLPGTGGLAGLLLTAAVLLAAVAAFERVGSLAGYDAHGADALAYVGGLLGGAWRPVLAVTVLVSLAASLQTTLVYLSRSVFGMGRDGVLPRALGALDRRGEPAVAVWSVAAVSVAFCLTAGLWPSAGGAFAFALGGTAWFLGLLFVLSAAAAVRLFAAAPQHRLTGALIPGVGAAALAGVLIAALGGDDTRTRGFIAASAIIGLPLALWRGRGPGRPISGSRF